MIKRDSKTGRFMKKAVSVKKTTKKVCESCKKTAKKPVTKKVSVKKISKKTK